MPHHANTNTSLSMQANIAYQQPTIMAHMTILHLLMTSNEIDLSMGYTNTLEGDMSQCNYHQQQYTIL